MKPRGTLSVENKSRPRDRDAAAILTSTIYLDSVSLDHASQMQMHVQRQLGHDPPSGLANALQIGLQTLVHRHTVSSGERVRYVGVRLVSHNMESSSLSIHERPFGMLMVVN